MSEEDCEYSADRGGQGGTVIDRHVGKRIMERRCDFEVPTEILAKELGISTDELTAIEDGRLRAGAQVLGHAAKALGVDISYFFEGLELRPAGAGSRNAKPGSAPNVISLKRRKKR